MKLSNLYILGSFSIFAAIAFKSYAINDGDLYDTCIYLITDKLYTLISFNALLALELLLSEIWIKIFIGEMNQVEKPKIMEKVLNVITEMVFSFFMVSASLDLEKISLVPLPFFLKYITFCFEERISTFSLGTTITNANTHKRIITAQIIHAAGSFYLLLIYLRKFISTHDSIILQLTMHLISCFISSTSDIVQHLIFVWDHENFGNSQLAYRLTLTNGLITDFIRFIFQIIFLIYQYTQVNFPLYILRSVYESVRSIYEKIQKFVKFFKLISILKTALPNATEEDLMREQICIICRNQMTDEDTKRLPCGHCFHLDCLERWIGQQVKCPVCQYDLAQILDGSEPNANEQFVEENNNNNNAQAEENENEKENNSETNENEIKQNNENEIKQNNENEINQNNENEINQNNENENVNNAMTDENESENVGKDENLEKGINKETEENGNENIAEVEQIEKENENLTDEERWDELHRIIDEMEECEREINIITKELERRGNKSSIL